MKSRVIFVLGGPGAGKGTQCKNMVGHYNFVHLSVGDLLRAERAKSPPSENAELIESFLKEGKLVPVSISLALVRQAMEKEKSGSVFLIDGFPRNDENLDGWQDNMNEIVDVAAVLVYDCPIHELQRRILERGETSGRSDDNLESAKKRFATFEKETMPVVKRLEEGGVRSVHIKGENSLEKVWEETKQAVDGIMIDEVVKCSKELDDCLLKAGLGGIEEYVDKGVVGDFREHLRIMLAGNGGRPMTGMKITKIAIAGKTATVELRGEGKEECIRVWERRTGVKGGWMMIHYSLRKGV